MAEECNCEKLKVHCNLTEFKVKFDDGSYIANTSYTVGAESSIKKILISGKGISGFSCIHHLVSFAVSAVLNCGRCSLLEYVLKNKVSYKNKQISTTECDRLIAELTTSEPISSSYDTARVKMVIHTLLNHTTVTIAAASGSPAACTIYELCDLVKNAGGNKQWRHGAEVAVIQRLKDGAIIPEGITNCDPPLHFAVRRALESGSHKLFDYILSITPAEETSKENQNHQTALDVVARYAGSDQRDLDHADVMTYVADQLIQKSGKTFTLQQYKRCVIDDNADNPLCHHLVKKLKTSELCEIPDTSAWTPGCEQELISRLRENTADQQELKVDGSFLHFVIHVTLKSGSTRLLRYAFKNIYKSSDSISETDSRGWSMMSRVQRQPDASHQNRVVCLNTLLMYDYVDIYEELNDNEMTEISDNSQSVMNNGFLEAMKNFKEFVDYRKQRGSSAKIRSEIRERMDLAESYTKDSPESFVHFMHRTKSERYFLDIIQNQDRELPRVLKKELGSRYRQTLNQRGCPLNGSRAGIFFICNNEVDMGFEESRSPFGDTRLMIPLDKVFDYPKAANKAATLDELGDLFKYNFYFADFYCVTVGKNHYVVIGVTERDSEDDEFCELHLIKLNPLDNPFFSIQDDGTAKCINKVWVYIFYMKDLHIAPTTNLYETPEGASQKEAAGEEHFTKVTRLVSQSGMYRVSRRSGRRVIHAKD